MSHSTFDSRDAYAMSVFWAAALGFAEDPDDPNEPGDEESMITRDQGLEWLLQLGARQVAAHRRDDGTGWVTLADPEGNEFCILRSDAERAATG